MGSFSLCGSLAGSARSCRWPLALAAAVLLVSGLQACGPVYGAKAAASPPCCLPAQHGSTA
ncbi:hypothetical protein [Synechococcus sp. GFB01]|uniref:hypothetical protein n=1 Tax=Synechococcus sp. GFB01 TaxID=1662190 RepID=UPI00064EC526|nr:hypothetical protein [Synechococcus sp. GFB01]KMM17530.1 hypothetical protein SYNGFB01_03400 [Synechococcus sp. GFB01]